MPYHRRTTTRKFPRRTTEFLFLLHPRCPVHACLGLFMEVHVNRLYNKPRNKTIGSPTPTGANYSDVHTHNSLSFCCFLFWPPQTQLHYYYYYLPDESLSASTLFLFHSSDAMNKIQSPLTSGQVELDWLGLALLGFPPSQWHFSRPPSSRRVSSLFTTTCAGPFPFPQGTKLSLLSLPIISSIYLVPPQFQSTRPRLLTYTPTDPLFILHQGR